jgi:hypothetical protein
MKKKIFGAGTLLLLALGFVPQAVAGPDLNEVAAFLVFPGVAAISSGLNVETFLTFTNTSTDAIIAHVSFINGDTDSPQNCYECNFDVPMTGQDTETLVLTRVAGQTHIVNLDTGASRTCSQKLGFVTVNVENSDHEPQTDNILLGEEVVIAYNAGAAFSVPAISVQGDVGDGDRDFEFDNKEYRLFPATIGGDFLAPDFGSGLHAYLILFTLGFERQFPPLSDCAIIGFDAFEEQFSNSFQFECWTIRDLTEIDLEFGYPNLGVSFDEQEHGWFQLDCRVFGTGENAEEIIGGVHGLIAQYADNGAILRRNAVGAPSLTGVAAWARILYQSTTNGTEMTLSLAEPVTGGF